MTFSFFIVQFLDEGLHLNGVSVSVGTVAGDVATLSTLEGKSLGVSSVNVHGVQVSRRGARSRQ